jgi:transcriptional regulator with AAA-type ATPase domain
MAKLFPNAADRHFASTLSHLIFSNPFLPERINYEREALGNDFVESDAIWSARPGEFQERPNLVRLQSRAEALASTVRARLSRMQRIEPAEAKLYADLAHYVIYYRSWRRFDELLDAPDKRKRVSTFKLFAEDHRHFFQVPPLPPPAESETHIFALYFQIRRAFQAIFRHIIGTSMPVARLRAGVWQSIFTCDLAAYRAHLFDRLDDVSTLITGESGTGKELVARAIALSRYLPFDPKTETFAAPAADLFLPLNLSALSPTLIESELFGHRRGAYTGALEDRIGWLEHCPPRGSVFLDEIGELDGQIQVKLLRVLQVRNFTRLGETASRPFAGKIIAATNRDLSTEISSGKFRRDLYYRLCADLITTPTLAQQLQPADGATGSADPEAELRLLVRFIAFRVAGPELADSLTQRVVADILANVGIDYAWPGNFRELEQCVRNVLLRGTYRPPGISAASRRRRSHDAAIDESSQQLALDMRQGNLTADELLDDYVRLVHATQGTYEATARKLQLDRRTVRARLERAHTRGAGT